MDWKKIVIENDKLPGKLEGKQNEKQITEAGMRILKYCFFCFTDISMETSHMIIGWKQMLIASAAVLLS